VVENNFTKLFEEDHKSFTTTMPVCGGGI